MRARNIKPGFFKNEDLAECRIEARLLFIGLWCMADREGRLEDRPKRIKLELFPADDVDCGSALEDLERWGFIVRYTVDSKNFIQITNFLKHQRPHIKEAASTFPPPPEHQPRMVLAPTKEGANNDQGECEHLSLPPDSLNPSSLIPDSLIPEIKNIPAFDKAVLPTEPRFYLTKKKKRLTGERLESFERFWKAFALQKDKASAADSWLSIPEYSSDLVERIIEAAKREATTRPNIIAKGHTPKWAQGWLSARRWEDGDEVCSPPVDREPTKDEIESLENLRRLKEERKRNLEEQGYA